MGEKNCICKDDFPGGRLEEMNRVKREVVKKPVAEYMRWK